LESKAKGSLLQLKSHCQSSEMIIKRKTQKHSAQQLSRQSGQHGMVEDRKEALEIT